MCSQLPSRVRLCNHMNLACLAPLSVVLSRQKYWNGLPFAPPGDLPHLGIKPKSFVSPVLAGRFFTTEPPGKLIKCIKLPNLCYLYKLHTHTHTHTNYNFFHIVGKINSKIKEIILSLFAISFNNLAAYTFRNIMSGLRTCWVANSHGQGNHEAYIYSQS